MTPRDIFLTALARGRTPRAATGSATSIVTIDLMDETGIGFPEAHLDAEKMATLAAAGHTVLGFDNVMPLFSVCHESAALGVPVDWGARDRMPTCGEPLFASIEDELRIPPDFLKRPECRVPLAAIALLRKRLGNDAAVVGKVFGPWTLGYHLYGLEEFLVSTILNPGAVKRAMVKMAEVTVAFGRAQVEAGADALTLGDHCTRDLCSPEAYGEFLAELHHDMHQRLGCPVILHICGDTADRIPAIATTGIECFHFDSKVPSAKARHLAGQKLALMGGTSNLDVVRRGTEQTIAADIEEKLRNGIDILGPECAVPLDAPWRNLRRIALAAKELSIPRRGEQKAHGGPARTA